MRYHSDFPHFCDSNLQIGALQDLQACFVLTLEQDDRFTGLTTNERDQKKMYVFVNSRILLLNLFIEKQV